MVLKEEDINRFSCANKPLVHCIMQVSTLFLTLAGIANFVNCQGTWEDLAPLPIIPRQEHTAVALNSTTLVVLGGIVQIGETWNNTDLVTLYDIPSNTWKSIAPLPLGLNHPNAAAVNGKIYLLGGLAELRDQNQTWQATPNCWVYDPQDDEWTSIASFPNGTERGSAAVGVFGSTIYLAGGLRWMEFTSGGRVLTVNEISAFDTLTRTWTSYPDSALPVLRDHAAGSVVGTTFYVTGGRSIGSGIIVSKTVYTLDLEDIEGGWELSPSTMPTARGGHAATVLGGSIYTFGGEGNFALDSGVFNNTEVFDTETATWTGLNPMKVPRHGTAALSVEGKIYIPGGGIVLGTEPTNVTDVFSP